MDQNKIRSMFPMLKHNITYLDSGALVQKPESVIRAILEFYTNYSISNRTSDSYIGSIVVQKIDETRQLVADLLECDKNEVMFNSGATEGLNYAAMLLSDMVKKDVKGVTLEVSSHGLALKRVDSVHFDIGIFTNVYEEHLDFHGTMENLMASKAKLFSLIDEKGYAILNTDEVRFYNLVKDQIKCHILTYGIEHKADIMARNIEVFIDHSEFDVQVHDELKHVSVGVLGRFNISNVLAVMTALLALEMPLSQVIDRVEHISGVDGRMELLQHPYPFHVIVDYCQHVKSYEKVFQFAQQVKKDGRIIAVFGAPGKKNYNKRQKIGKLANQYCDQVILTAEDNRDEDIQDICLDIQKYIEKPVSVIIEDRRIAIEQAIEIANRHDIILILGKGHEQFMASAIGNDPYPGDKYVALEAINKIFKGEEDNGKEMEQID